MTQTARLVLQDCRFCLEMLETEENLDRWRILHAAALALLRAVGHALDKADGEEVRAVARRKYADWKASKPEPDIFWEFVNAQRNLVLKEYRHDVDIAQSQEIAVDGNGEPYWQRNFLAKMSGVYSEQIEGILYRPNTMDFRFGDDFRDTYEEAIEWWDMQITEIEQEISKAR